VREEARALEELRVLFPELQVPPEPAVERGLEQQAFPGFAAEGKEPEEE